MALEDLFGMQADQIFQSLFLPMMIVFAILWALLNSVRVFDRKINTVLAVALTIMVAASPQFTLFTTYVAQLGAQVAIAAFGVLFIFGTLAWMFGSGRDIYYEHVEPSGRVENLIKKKRKYLEKARDAADAGRNHDAKEWQKRARDVDDELQMLSLKK
ncbi:MAG: hypothetical protein ABIA12_01920 [Candidatus Aenigmatarchaeota archaeon]